MSDTAQNPNVNDIWSMPDLTDDQNQPIPQKPSAGGFGKPGIAVGEGGGWESDAKVEKTAEIYKTSETLPSPEVGEKQKPAEAQKPKGKPKTELPKVVQKPLSKPNVVDTRTNKEITHRVDINKADKVTKVADIKEQEFIEGVETVHSIV